MTRAKPRRAIALSPADQARLESGELTRPEDALGTGDDGPAPADQGSGDSAASPDERLLREVPPHFGNL